MPVLEEMTHAIEHVAARVGPAVVGLGRGWGRGSGVVVEPGAVLTNAHNLRGDELVVTFADGRREPAVVAGADLDSDVAVVTVDTGSVEPVEWPDAPTTPGMGTVVLALANPGGRGLRVTLGTVAAVERSFRGPRGRRIRGAIEHTAPLPRGSSGGPLVDGAGSLVGLNAVRVDGGLIVAIPTDGALRERVGALRRGEARARPRLGVAIAPSYVARRLRQAVGLPERDGLLVRNVEDASPAARAGIERGDLIVAAGGETVAELDDLVTRLESARGSTLMLGVVRGADERTIGVDLAGAETVR